MSPHSTRTLERSGTLPKPPATRLGTIGWAAIGKLPRPLRERALSTGALMRSLSRLPFESLERAVVIEGERAGAPLRVVVVGSGPYLDYVLPRVFPGGWSVASNAVRDRGRGDRGHGHRHRSRIGYDESGDLVLVERSRLLPALDGYRRLPSNIRMSLVLEGGPAPTPDQRRENERMRRKVSTSGVEFEDFPLRTSPEMLELFYRELYAPHTATRYGAESVQSLASMRAIYRDGFLRIARLRGTPIAGALFTVDRRTLLLCKYGVRDPGDPVHRAAGSLSLQLDYARERGYERYDAFHARPFFEDGIFRFKRSCGLAVSPETRPIYWDTDLYLRVVRSSGAVLDFLHAEPHLRLCSDGNIAACLCPSPGSDSIEAATEELRHRHTPGIDRYELMVSRVPTANARRQLEGTFGESSLSIAFVPAPWNASACGGESPA